MIIGDNNFKNNSFENKFKRYNNNKNNQNNNHNIFVKDIKENVYSNASSTKDMNDKALAMLNERLKNGLITLEEFNRKCQELAKRRNK